MDHILSHYMHAEHSGSGAGPAALSTIKTSESSDDEDPLYHDVLYYKGGMLYWL